MKLRIFALLATSPAAVFLAGAMSPAGYEAAARKATRSFAGWHCTVKRTELQRYNAGPLPLILNVDICDQWTRPRCRAGGAMRGGPTARARAPRRCPPDGPRLSGSPMRGNASTHLPPL